MRRMLPGGLLATLAICLTVQVNAYELGEPVLVQPGATAPDAWGETIAYTDSHGGAVYLYDGQDSFYVFGPDEQSFSPSGAGGVLAWRNVRDGENDIYRWDGVEAVNISNSPGVADVDVVVGANGDCIWSTGADDLMYYNAAEGVTAPLGIRGIHPDLHVRHDGVVTYAYQDPDTLMVKYFDGDTTHDVGIGAEFGAEPSLFDGAIAYVGEAEVGSLFFRAEIFFWKDGETTRITNDDDLNGRLDKSPNVWNDMIVWARFPTSPFSPRLFFWDGTESEQLLDGDASTPTFAAGNVAWVNDGGLWTAPLLPPPLPGDVNCDGVINGFDIDPFVLALTDPAGYEAAFPDCDILRADVDEDGAVTGFDIEGFVALLVGP